MTFLKKIDLYLEEYFLVLSLMVMVALIFLQVVLRYVFQFSLSWSEEMSRYIYAWQIWVGASFAVKHRKHVKVEAFKNLFAPGVQRWMDVFAILCWLALSLVLVKEGAQLVTLLLARGQVSPAMRVPMGYAYASVPVGCGLMAFRLLQQLYVTIKTPPGAVRG
ncbi:hypothetical protein SY88_16790 [Clostridiales bacterium PH28_bin88]|nr:hypothetical protein SY88_16790 [Clostridiales bacterium PH28_bin88]